MGVDRHAGLVSVILVNFRGIDNTLTCIESLRALDWPADRLEVVVVENASGDDSADRLRSVDGITLVLSPENLGFAGGCNLGVARSSGEYVAFLNNDARPDERWVAEAVAVLDADRQVGAVASKVLDWEGDRVDYVDASITWYGMGYKPHTGERDRGAWDEARDVLFGTGAAMFVRASVFESLGGFDERYFMFYEDVDLGWRLNLAGHRFRFVPSSLAFHRHHQSMSSFGSYREQYLLERNALFTLFKNLDDVSLAEVLPNALMLAVRRSVARGGLDAGSLDIRRATPDGETDEQMLVAKSTMAGVFAIDRVVEELPALAASRREIQRSRVRSDMQLRRLFGDVDEPAYPIADYQAGYEALVTTSDVLSVTQGKRILVITGDPIGRKMAGPAIRAWNIALQLSAEHSVRLVSMSSVDRDDAPFELATVSYPRPSTMAPHEEWADVIVLQGHALHLFPVLERSQKVIVVDIYDPLHLEALEQGKDLPLSQWNDRVGDATFTLNHQLERGDFFICASERQRSLWLGQLAGLGRVNAYTYSEDDDLQRLIATVPFGIPGEDPVATRPAMRGVVPGIADHDKIILWAGGIYDWFDPVTLIEAVAELAGRHDDVRLFFMGVQHPNADVPEMAAVGRARRRAEELGVTDRHVFFNETWVAYDERQNYLLEADLGVSTHFVHVETTFSFRTRMLDYLWAGLPMISTEGDSFADLIDQHELGASVPERDVTTLAGALERLLYTDAGAAARMRVAEVREQFRWPVVLRPLVEFCRAPRRAADARATGGVTPGRSRDRRRARTGVRRDLTRAVYYLRTGGPAAVVERLRARTGRAPR